MLQQSKYKTTVSDEGMSAGELTRSHWDTDRITVTLPPVQSFHTSQEHFKSNFSGQVKGNDAQPLFMNAHKRPSCSELHQQRYEQY